MSKHTKSSNNTIEMLDLIMVDFLLRIVELDPMIPTFNQENNACPVHMILH